MPHAATTKMPNALRIHRTAVNSMNAPIPQRMGRVRRSTRAAAMSRQPTALAPRYPADATSPWAMRLAGIRLRVRPLVSGWMVMALTLPPASTAMTAWLHS